jgi:GNAT superfamily N-acetyltransferase
MSPATAVASALRLLRVETQVLWGAASVGREPPPAALVLVAADGIDVRLAPAVTVADLAGPWSGGPSYLVRPGGPAAPPAVWVDGAAEVHVGGELVARCFSSRDAPEGREAGVWTHPAHRRRGYGAAVVACWAAGWAAVDDRPSFYSTSADNLASQALAARLDLRPLGWMWKLSPNDPPPSGP